MALLMRDHPGWMAVPDGAHRVMRAGHSVWHLHWRRGTHVTVSPLPGNTVPGSDLPIVDTLTSPHLAPTLAGLGKALEQLGPVQRARNSDLWDAIGTAIIRQVIRAPQARDMYGRFCREHGEPAMTADGIAYLFPTAQAVADLPDQAFAVLGMAFKRPVLQAAAAAYLTHGPAWDHQPASGLVTALQQVPRIGPWTAGAAAADVTGDFSCYPYADLAVRTWARTAAPDVAWPETEPEFAHLWRTAAGDTTLSDVTLMTLAWGDSRVRAP